VIEVTQDRAVERLHQLVAEAQGFAHSFDHGNLVTLFIQMKHEAAAIVATYLGSDHHIVRKLDGLKVGGQTSAIAMSLGGMSLTNEFVGLVRAAINFLGVSYGRPAPIRRCAIRSSGSTLKNSCESKHGTKFLASS
jgi:hypothetical protein